MVKAKIGKVRKNGKISKCKKALIVVTCCQVVSAICCLVSLSEDRLTSGQCSAKWTRNTINHSIDGCIRRRSWSLHWCKRKKEKKHFFARTCMYKRKSKWVFSQLPPALTWPSAWPWYIVVHYHIMFPSSASATSRCPAVSQGPPASAPAWPRSAAPLKAPHNLERLTDREMCVLLFRHLRIPLSISQIHGRTTIKCSRTLPLGHSCGRTLLGGEAGGGVKSTYGRGGIWVKCVNASLVIFLKRERKKKDTFRDVSASGKKRSCETAAHWLGF